MEIIKCVICLRTSEKQTNKEFSNAPTDGSQTTAESHSQILTNQLEIVFLLRKVLQVPEDICYGFLEGYGNPCTWMNYCHYCSVLVTQARDIFTQITELEKKFKALQKKVRTAIFQSAESPNHCDDFERGPEAVVRSYVRFGVKKPSRTSKFKEDVKVKTEDFSDSFDNLEYSPSPFTENTEDAEDYHHNNNNLWEQEDNSYQQMQRCSDSPLLNDQNTTLEINNIKVEERFCRSSKHRLTQKALDYSCTTCGKQYNSAFKLKIHKRKHTEKVHLRTKKKNSKTNTLKCRKKIPKKPRPYSCETCGSKFTLLASLKCHEKLHSGGNRKECDICGKTFAHASSFIYHLQTHTGEKTFSCEICKKSFVQSSDLKNHIKIHTGEKPYECEICRRKFSTISNCRSHRKTHAKVKERFPCDICKKSFSKSATLSSHLKVHSGETPYSCETCGKMFAQSSSLKNHVKVHTGEKTFVCDFCGKGFSMSSNFRKHRMIHTGEKPHVCGICGKEFVQLNGLKVHIATHSTEKPYTCDICGKCFKKHSYFKEHLSGHKEGKSYTCRNCGKIFTHSHHLRRHEKTHAELT